MKTNPTIDELETIQHDYTILRYGYRTAGQLARYHERVAAMWRRHLAKSFPRRNVKGCMLDNRREAWADLRCARIHATMADELWSLAIAQPETPFGESSDNVTPEDGQQRSSMIEDQIDIELRTRIANIVYWYLHEDEKRGVRKDEMET